MNDEEKTTSEVKGRLLVFEGADEVGKTTLAQMLSHELRLHGENITELAFPGNQPGTLGAHIYSLHHRPTDHSVTNITAESLQLLHLAAHFDVIDRFVLPALANGGTVILDRFWWSTLAYGIASGANQRFMDKVVELEKIHWGSIVPEAVFLIQRPTPLLHVSDIQHWQRVVNQYMRLGETQRKLYPIYRIENISSARNALDKILSLLLTQRLGDQHHQLNSDDESKTLSTNLHIPLTPARPTIVYDTYWKFAAARQEIFFRKMSDPFGPWTADPILGSYKFTNTYRASDRTSQYLIKHVQYQGDQSPEELFFRTLIFKTFNRIQTWELLKNKLGEVRASTYRFEDYDNILSQAIADSPPIYSAAYIMTSGKSAFGADRKHRNHLRLIEIMMHDELPQRVRDTRSLQEVFELLLGYPTLGNFLAYQYAIDLNYSSLTQHSEMEFVVPGPGARDGLRKCFSDMGGLTEADLIRFVTERQNLEFARLEIDFQSLWGRPLQLIDCQNIFCEVDKYSRVKHPEVAGLSGRTKIKQKYRQKDDPINYWYPPKWNINEFII